MFTRAMSNRFPDISYARVDWPGDFAATELRQVRLITRQNEWGNRSALPEQLLSIQLDT